MIPLGLPKAGLAILVAIGPDRVDFTFRNEGDPAYYGLDQVSAVAHTTFTEALQNYATKNILPLNGAQLYIAVAGAVGRDVTKVTNGRWFLSRTGIKAVTGCEPIVVNDVAAMAYAALGDQAKRLFGQRARHDAIVGSRCVLVWAGNGLGAACLLNDEPIRIVDSEAGHLPFVPLNADQLAYADLHTDGRTALSYERVIISLQDDLLLQANPTQNAVTYRMLAEVLGQFCGSFMLSVASWQTLLVCGPVFNALEQRNLGDTVLDAVTKRLGSRRTLPPANFLILDGDLVMLRGLMTFYNMSGSSS